LKYAGRAHLFNANGDLVYSFQSNAPSRGGFFGYSSLSLDSNIMVLSETGAKINITGAGRIHLYDPQGNYLKYLESPSPRSIGKFGQTVKVGQGLILVGEYGDTSRYAIGNGTVYAFDYSGNHLFTLQAPEPENQAIFGHSIALSEELIILGEPWATVDDKHRAGQVHVFSINGDYLLTLHSPNPEANGVYGWGLAIEEDRIVVGEWNADVTPSQYEGRAYVYDTEGNLLQNLTAPDPCPRAAFGMDVDICGDMIVVGEYWATSSELGQAGRVHVFKLGAPPPDPDEPPEVTHVLYPEDDEDDNGGIPGYPALSILAALIICYLLYNQRK